MRVVEVSMPIIHGSFVDAAVVPEWLSVGAEAWLCIGPLSSVGPFIVQSMGFRAGKRGLWVLARYADGSLVMCPVSLLRGL
jgi:hypothetical protein